MRAAIAGLAALAFGLKLAIALQTFGTNDVLTWGDFLAFLRAHGGIALYQDQVGPWFFNHPPFMLHVLEGMGALTALSGLPFPFWLRLPSILADVGSLLVVAGLVTAEYTFAAPRADQAHAPPLGEAQLTPLGAAQPAGLPARQSPPGGDTPAIPLGEAQTSPPGDGQTARLRAAQHAPLGGRGTRGPALALMLMAIAPISIMVSGFHGNTDPVMIFFVLLSIYLLDVRRTPWLAAIAFGMAVNVKVVPLILIPTFAFSVWSMRPSRAGPPGSVSSERLFAVLRLMTFFSVAASVVVVGSLPYLVQDPGMIALHVLGYASTYGNWGVPRVLGALFPATPLPGLYQLWGRVVVLMFLVPLAHAIQRKRPQPALFDQCGVIMFFFLALTPGFGIQYLVWLVPWVVGRSVVPSAIYFATSGVFGFLVYNRWSLGLPWYFADARELGWNGSLIWFELLCWGSVVLILGLMLRRILRNDPPAASSPHPVYAMHRPADDPAWPTAIDAA